MRPSFDVAQDFLRSLWKKLKEILAASPCLHAAVPKQIASPSVAGGEQSTLREERRFGTQAWLAGTKRLAAAAVSHKSSAPSPEKGFSLELISNCFFNVARFMVPAVPAGFGQSILDIINLAVQGENPVITLKDIEAEVLPNGRKKVTISIEKAYAVTQLPALRDYQLEDGIHLEGPDAKGRYHATLCATSQGKPLLTLAELRVISPQARLGAEPDEAGDRARKRGFRIVSDERFIAVYQELSQTGNEPTQQMLADKLGITQSAVWFRLRQLRKQGIQLPTKGLPVKHRHTNINKESIISIYHFLARTGKPRAWPLVRDIAYILGLRPEIISMRLSTLKRAGIFLDLDREYVNQLTPGQLQALGLADDGGFAAWELRDLVCQIQEKMAALIDEFCAARKRDPREYSNRLKEVFAERILRCLFGEEPKTRPALGREYKLGRESIRLYELEVLRLWHKALKQLDVTMEDLAQLLAQKGALSIEQESTLVIVRNIPAQHPLIPITQLLAFLSSAVVGVFTFNLRPARIFWRVFSFAHAHAFTYICATGPPWQRKLSALFTPVADNGFTEDGQIRWRNPQAIEKSTLSPEVEQSIRIHEAQQSKSKVLGELKGLWAQFAEVWEKRGKIQIPNWFKNLRGGRIGNSFANANRSLSKLISGVFDSITRAIKKSSPLSLHTLTFRAGLIFLLFSVISSMSSCASSLLMISKWACRIKSSRVWSRSSN